MMHCARRGVAFAGLLGLLGGCGLDELFVSVGEDMKGGSGGQDAAQLDPDGGLGTGGEGSGGAMEELDAAMADSGAGDPLDPFDWSSCSPSDEVIDRVEVPSVEASEQALSVGTEGFGIAYRIKDGCDRLVGATLSAFGPLATGVTLVGEGQCTAYRDLSLLRGDDNWLLAWVDNSTGSAELHAQYFDNQLLALSGPLQLSDSAERELRPALAHLGDTPVVAYIAEGPQGSAIISKRLDTNDAAVTVLAASAGHAPRELVLSALGLTGAALAWVNEGGLGGVHLQVLSETGAAVGRPQQLSPHDGPTVSLDLTRQTRGADVERGGAIVYSVQLAGGTPQVRFRRLSEAGLPVADERTLVSAPLRARDASITAVGDGYAIAYRALPDGKLVTSPEIRLLFTTREGNLARDTAGRPITYKVADATESTGRVTMRLSVEGQLLLSWIDFDPESGAQVLKHVRRPLSCP